MYGRETYQLMENKKINRFEINVDRVYRILSNLSMSNVNLTHLCVMQQQSNAFSTRK